MIILKSEAEIAIMRRAGSLVWHVIDRIGQAVRPGVTTRELDAIAENTKTAAQGFFKGTTVSGEHLRFCERTGDPRDTRRAEAR